MDYEAEDKYAVLSCTFYMRGEDYIKSIRNADKKEYAWRYMRWLWKGSKGDFEDNGIQLGSMARQAVRMALREIKEQVEEQYCGIL